MRRSSQNHPSESSDTSDSETRHGKCTSSNYTESGSEYSEGELPKVRQKSTGGRTRKQQKIVLDLTSKNRQWGKHTDEFVKEKEFLRESYSFTQSQYSDDDQTRSCNGSTVFSQCSAKNEEEERPQSQPPLDIDNLEGIKVVSLHQEAPACLGKRFFKETFGNHVIGLSDDDTSPPKNKERLNRQYESWGDLVLDFPELVERTTKEISLTKQAQRNGVLADAYLRYRNPYAKVDRYQDEVFVDMLKPITPLDREKILAKNAEKKRLEREKYIKEMEKELGEPINDKRKLNNKKKKKYTTDWEPDSKTEPWWVQVYNDKSLFELNAHFRYALQQILSPEQIKSLRETLNRDGGGVDVDKVKNSKQKKTKKDNNLYSGSAASTPAPVRAKSQRAASKTASVKMSIESMPFDSFSNLQFGKNTHELVECQQFLKEDLQPFVLYISLETLILLTVQSHLHRNEVIGYLAGYKVQFQKNKEILVIQEAFPCKAMPTAEGTTNQDLSINVEMCPESAQKNIDLIKKRGMTLLGWYHSHPRFEPNPSHIDIVNHDSYQSMFDESQKQKHFFGLIISPYYFPKELSHSINALPYVRCFRNFKHDERVVPYEIVTNVLSQTHLNATKLLEDIKAVAEDSSCNDIYVLEEINLQIQRAQSPLFLNGADKLIRTLRQIFSINFEKIRSQHTFVRVARMCDQIALAKKASIFTNTMSQDSHSNDEKDEHGEDQQPAENQSPEEEGEGSQGKEAPASDEVDPAKEDEPAASEAPCESANEPATEPEEKDQTMKESSDTDTEKPNQKGSDSADLKSNDLSEKKDDESIKNSEDTPETSETQNKVEDEAAASTTEEAKPQHQLPQQPNSPIKRGVGRPPNPDRPPKPPSNKIPISHTELHQHGALAIARQLSPYYQERIQCISEYCGLKIDRQTGYEMFIDQVREVIGVSQFDEYFSSDDSYNNDYKKTGGFLALQQMLKIRKIMETYPFLRFRHAEQLNSLQGDAKTKMKELFKSLDKAKKKAEKSSKDRSKYIDRIQRIQQVICKKLDKQITGGDVKEKKEKKKKKKKRSSSSSSSSSSSDGSDSEDKAPKKKKQRSRSSSVASKTSLEKNKERREQQKQRQIEMETKVNEQRELEMMQKQMSRKTNKGAPTSAFEEQMQLALAMSLSEQ